MSWDYALKDEHMIIEDDVHAVKEEVVEKANLGRAYNLTNISPSQIRSAN